MGLATSLRPLRLTVSALASSTPGLPMPMLSTFPSPATRRPEDHLQPVPVGDPHGYSRRRTPVSVAVAMCFLLRPEGLGRRANTVGNRERSAAFPPSLARTRRHHRLSFKPVGYPVTGPGGADMPIYPTRRASRALSRPTHRDLRLTSECEAQSCAVGGWWYGGISGHTLAQRLSTGVCIVLCWMYE